MTRGNLLYIPLDLSTALSNGSLCLNYLKKYVSLVTVESPDKSVIKSMRDVSATFDKRLAKIGAHLAVFLGKDYSIIYTPLEY